MNRTAKNYFADGGDKLVIDGELEVNGKISGSLAKAMSGDLAFKCTPATLTTAIAKQNAGTAQVMKATISGTVKSDGAGNIKVTVVADGLENGEKTITVAVANGDDEEKVALAIKTALAEDADIAHSSTGMFTVAVSGAEITLTKKTESFNDDTMDFIVETDTAEFEDDDGLDVDIEITEGVAPYTRDVLVQLTDSEGNVHRWFNGVVPVTIADNAVGTASIETTDPVMENGEMTVTVTLTGTWAAGKTNTLTVSQKTILGYTVAAKTSVETSVE